MQADFARCKAETARRRRRRRFNCPFWIWKCAGIRYSVGLFKWARDLTKYLFCINMYGRLVFHNAVIKKEQTWKQVARRRLWGVEQKDPRCCAQSAIKINLQYSDHYSSTQGETTVYGFPGTKLGIIVLTLLNYLLMTFNCPIGPLWDVKDPAHMGPPYVHKYAFLITGVSIHSALMCLVSQERMFLCRTPAGIVWGNPSVN